MNRRTFLLSSLAMPLLAPPALANPPRLTVHRTPECGCCGAWAGLVRAAGFDVTMIEMTAADLRDLRTSRGVPQDLAACHTSELDGYVIEGHVPPEDIRRLIATRPDAVGIAVPGMQAGSPGMETAAPPVPFDTMLIGRDGSVSVFRAGRV